MDLNLLLPNGADRSTDALRCNCALTLEQQQGFSPPCPNFAIKLRSPSDRLQPLQAKMPEYLENGLRLGWLINPQGKQVEIYRPNQPVETVSLPATLSGEDVLPGFSLQVEA